MPIVAFKSALAECRKINLITFKRRACSAALEFGGNARNSGRKSFVHGVIIETLTLYGLSGYSRVSSVFDTAARDHIPRITV